MLALSTGSKNNELFMSLWSGCSIACNLNAEWLDLRIYLSWNWDNETYVLAAFKVRKQVAVPISRIVGVVTARKWCHHDNLLNNIFPTYLQKSLIMNCLRGWFWRNGPTQTGIIMLSISWEMIESIDTETAAPIVNWIVLCIPYRLNPTTLECM